MYFGMFGAVFFLSQYLQLVLGNRALQAGLKLLLWTGSVMVVSPLAGVLSARYGSRPFLAAGLALQAAALGVDRADRHDDDQLHDRDRAVHLRRQRDGARLRPVGERDPRRRARPTRPARPRAPRTRSARSAASSASRCSRPSSPAPAATRPATRSSAAWSRRSGSASRCSARGARAGGGALATGGGRRRRGRPGERRGRRAAPARPRHLNPISHAPGDRR